MKRVCYLFFAFWISFAAAFSGFARLPVQAATPTYQYNKHFIYDVADDLSTVNVTINIKVTFTKPGGYYLESPQVVQNIFLVRESTSSQELAAQKESLRVTDAQGNKVPFSTTNNERSFEVLATYPHRVNSGQSFTIQVNYQTQEMSYQLGRAGYIVFPGYNEDYDFSGKFSNDSTYEVSERVTVKAPAEQFALAKLDRITPDPQNTRTVGDQVLFEYKAQDLLQTSGEIVAGDYQIFRFEYINTVNPTQKKKDIGSSLLKNRYHVSIPYDIPAINQTVVYDYVYPLPNDIEFEEVIDYEAPYLVYYLPPNDTTEIYISGYIKVDPAYRQASLQDDKISAIPSEMVPAYTDGQTYWEVDNPIIQKQAEELMDMRKDKDSLWEAVTQSYNYVIDRLDYNFSKAESREDNIRWGAVDSWQKKSGVCMEYSDLLVSLLRAQGIPAISANGAGYDLSDTPDDFIGHQWVLVYFPSSGWVPVDPTWGENGATLIGPDLEHAYFEIMEESVTSNSFIVSYLGWDEDYGLLAPEVFLHPQTEIPTQPVREIIEAGQANYRLINTQKVQQQSNSELNFFAGYPYLTVSELAAQIEEHKEGEGFLAKVGNSLEEFSTTGFAHELWQASPLLVAVIGFIAGLIFLVIVTKIIKWIWRIFHRNQRSPPATGM